MKLQYLVLSNIGPFRERHVVDFRADTESTGYAFFAANGRGKTSIYNAMKWCLFGEVKTRVRATTGSKIKPKKNQTGNTRTSTPLVGAARADPPPRLFSKEVSLCRSSLCGHLAVAVWPRLPRCCASDSPLPRWHAAPRRCPATPASTRTTVRTRYTHAPTSRHG